MKVVILAGGRGTRISEHTKLLPKPLIKIGKYPIILRIMMHYSKFGFNDFIIATGYKGNLVENFFKRNFFNWNVSCIYTGLNTMTGGRIKKLKNFLGERFLLTYGDGLSDVNIKKLINFHIKNKNIATLTAVRPPARFGGLKILKSKVTYFKEKSKLDEGWINGGFFVFERKIFRFIKNDKSILERNTLENICNLNKLGAFRHYGFWQCMDTLRDKEVLDKMFKYK